MAKENIAFLVNLRKNTAVGTDREGRYYPEAESKEALTTKGFAKHVSEHGGLVTTRRAVALTTPVAVTAPLPRARAID